MLYPFLVVDALYNTRGHAHPADARQLRPISQARELRCLFAQNVCANAGCLKSPSYITNKLQTAINFLPLVNNAVVEDHNAPTNQGYCKCRHFTPLSLHGNHASSPAWISHCIAHIVIASTAMPQHYDAICQTNACFEGREASTRGLSCARRPDGLVTNCSGENSILASTPPRYS